MKHFRLWKMTAFLVCVLLMLPTATLSAQTDSLAEGQTLTAMTETDDTDQEADSEIEKNESDAAETASETDSESIEPAAAEITSDEAETDSQGRRILTSQMTSLSSGSYILTEDIILSQFLTIEDKAEVTLDLNGHVLCLKADSNQCVIKNYGYLTLEDSNPDAVHSGTLRYVNTGAMNTQTRVASPYTDPDGNDWYAGLWCWDETGAGSDKKGPYLEHVDVTGGLITGGRYSGIINYRGLTINGGTLCGNFANDSYIGSAITTNGYVNSSVEYFNMNGGKVIYNYTPNQNWNRFGAVLIYQCETNIARGEFYGNASDYGGAIFIDGNNNWKNTKVVIGCSEKDCSGDCVRVYGNHSHRGGGGIYTSTPGAVCTIQCGTYEHNWTDTAIEYGGDGDYKAYDIEQVNDIRCNAAFLTVTGGTIGLIENRFYDANQKYGEIDIEGGLIHFLFNYGGDTYISGGQIGYIKAKVNEKLGRKTTVVITGGEISQEYAVLGNQIRQTNAAGETVPKSGISITGGDVTMTGGTIRGCFEAASGGAVRVWSGNFVMGSSTTEGISDPVIENCQALVNGGAIYIDDGKAVISGGIIQNNQAGQNGGAIDIAGGYAELSGGVIRYNTAGENGGGVSVYGEEGTVKQTVVIQGSVLVESNTADRGNGGGIYIQNVDLTMNGGTIQNNTVESWDLLQDKSVGNGGGIYISGGNVTMLGTQVEGNTCPQDGGGIYMDGGGLTGTDQSSLQVELSGGKIQNNMAGQYGGGIASYRVKVLMQTSDGTDGTSIIGNTAVNGGGVFVEDDADMSMQEGDILENHAVALDCVSTTENSFYLPIQKAAGLSGEERGENSTSLVFIDEDDKGGNGGGIYLENSAFSLQGQTALTSGVISDNLADGDGGGIYALHSNETADGALCSSTAASLDIQNGSVMNNEAKENGGALAVFAYGCSYEPETQQDQSDATLHQHCQLKIQGSVFITENKASNGGGIYVGGGETSIQGGVIRENRAEGLPDSSVTTAYYPDQNTGVGGGVYVYRTGSLILRNSKASSDGSSNELDLGVYSNTADFAADDVYCSPAAASDILLPAVSNMNLIDYENHQIGRAEDWFEDYPTNDSSYNNAGTAGLNTRRSSASVRYRAASENEKVALTMSSDEQQYNGYLCLTLGFNYTRVNLTVSKEVDGGEPGDTAFNFTVTIHAKDSLLDEEKTLGYDYPYLIFGATETERQSGNYAYTITQGSDLDSTDAALKDTVIRFSLKNHESIVLQGIPAGAEVSVTENGSPVSDTTSVSADEEAFSLDGYQASYVLTQQEEETGQQGENFTISNIGKTYASLVCTNMTGFSLPNAGKKTDYTVLYCLTAVLLAASLLVAYNNFRGEKS